MTIIEEIAGLVKEDCLSGNECRFPDCQCNPAVSARAMLERLQAENKSAGDAGVTDAMVEAAKKIVCHLCSEGSPVENGWHGYGTPDYSWCNGQRMRSALEAALSLAPQNSVSTGPHDEPFTEGRGAAKVASSPVLAGGAALALIEEARKYTFSSYTPSDGSDGLIARLAAELSRVSQIKLPAPVPLTDDALREILKEECKRVGAVVCFGGQFPSDVAKAALAALRRVSQPTPAQQEPPTNGL